MSETSSKRSCCRGRDALCEPAAVGDLPPGSGPRRARRPGPVPQPVPLPRRPAARHLRRRGAEEDPAGVGGHPSAEPAEEQPGRHPHRRLQRQQGPRLSAHAALPAAGDRLARLQGAEEARLPLPVQQRDQQHQAGRLRGPGPAHLPLPGRQPDRRAQQGHLLPHDQPLHPAAQRQQAARAAGGDLRRRPGPALAAHERQRAEHAAAGLAGRGGEPGHPAPGQEQDVQLPRRRHEQAAGGGGADAGEEPHEEHPGQRLPELRTLRGEAPPGQHGAGEVFRRCVHWRHGRQVASPGQQQAEVSSQEPGLQLHHQPDPVQQPLELHLPAGAAAQVDGRQQDPSGRCVRVSPSSERQAGPGQSGLQRLQSQSQEGQEGHTSLSRQEATRRTPLTHQPKDCPSVHAPEVPAKTNTISPFGPFSLIYSKN